MIVWLMFKNTHVNVFPPMGSGPSQPGSKVHRYNDQSSESVSDSGLQCPASKIRTAPDLKMLLPLSNPQA